MAEHGVFLASKMASQNVDALNRNAVAEVDLDNGMAVVLGKLSSDADKSQVFEATLPTEATVKGIWIVDEPTLGVAEDTLGGQYSTGVKDPRKCYNPAGKVISVRKPQEGCLFKVSADMVSGTANDYINVTTTGKYIWASTAGAGFAAKLLENDYFSIGMTSETLSQRADAYRFEVVQN